MKMTKFVAVLAAVAFTTGIAGFAFAQNPPPPATPVPAPAPATEKKPEAKTGDMKKSDKKMAAKNVNGMVKSASADNVVVAGKEKGKDAEWTFSVDPKTAIKKGGKSVTTGDLKPGDNVNVRYMDHDGKAVAQAVTVRAAAKKDDTMKKEEAKPAEKK